MTAAANGGAAVNLRAWAAEAEAAAGIARALAPTPFVPEGLRRYVENDDKNAPKVLDLEGTIATVTAVLLAGQELKMGPMASLRSITIIKGTVALYALAMRGLLLRAGHEIVVKESTDQRAIVDARRTGDTEWQRATWDLQRARTARLYPGSEYGNWRTNPKAMLVARATAEAARWVAPDEMLGLPLIAEEIADRDVEIIPEIPEPPAAEEPPKPASARRRNPPRRAALPAAPPHQPTPGPPPPDPGAPPPSKPTKAARDRMFAGLKTLGLTDKDDALTAISGWVDRQVGATGELDAAETKVVLDHIDVLIAAKEAEAKEAADAGDQADEEGGPEGAEPDGQ
jgi:hypothetical protein